MLACCTAGGKLYVASSLAYGNLVSAENKGFSCILVYNPGL